VNVSGAQPNSRALVAVAILLIGLALYAAAVVTLADYLPDHWAIEGIYALITGLIWVWPAIALFRWAAGGQRR
jgi:hypothetical protein